MKVVLSKKALQDLQSILDYVGTEFGRRTAQKLEARINDLLKTLKRWPEAHHMVYPEQQVRRAVVHPRVVMFYKVYHVDDLLFVTRFMTTYQNYSPEDVS